MIVACWHSTIVSSVIHRMRGIGITLVSLVVRAVLDFI